ncbi:MAG: hypothetical protein NZ772_03655 [Cyanobacteria bacterium]|nr:hypothetical protein [Cyanobacteriota bacterium]MDW8200552.1 hypothetical protein [Cyanobacteriota bacterium SKYGB_h_bin112]
MRSFLNKWDPEQLFLIGVVLLGIGIAGLGLWFIVSLVMEVRRTIRRKRRRQRL